MIALVLAASLVGPDQVQVYCQDKNHKTVYCGDPAAIVGPVLDLSPPVTQDLADRMGEHAWWVGMGTAFDLLGTAAFQKWCGQCREANPLIFSPAAAVPIKIASDMITMGGIWKVEKAGHHRQAKVIRWTGFGLQAAAGAWNFGLAIWGSRHPVQPPAMAKR